MITEYNVTDLYNEKCYNEYYKKSIDWNAYYEYLAEEGDREGEDN